MTRSAIPMKALRNIPAAIFAIAALCANATDKTDLWWNPAESGWGMTIANQGDNATTVDAAGSYFYTSLDGDVQVSTDRGDHWASVGNWVGALSALWSGLAPDEAKGLFAAIGA